MYGTGCAAICGEKVPHPSASPSFTTRLPIPVATELRQQRRNRLMLLLIALISVIPFVLAWLYLQHPQWASGHSNYGHLITPARPLAYEELLRPDAPGAAPLAPLKGRWILLQVATGEECNAACRNSLQLTHQIRLLLNKDITRVRRLLLRTVPGGAPVEGFEQDEDLRYGQLSEALLARLTEAVGHPPEDGTVMLIDPFANLMMWYGRDFDPYGVLKDLKHLLRYSQIG